MKHKTQYITYIIISLFLCSVLLQAQNELSMQETMLLAQKQSLSSYKNKNVFLSNHWSYKSYKSSFLPHLNWYVNPVNYNRRMTVRYDYENNIDVYREQQTLSSYTGLNLSQVIVATGGKVYLESDIYRLQNFNSELDNSYSSTPFRIGLNQPIGAYNTLKWQKILSPIKYEKAKQEYIQSVQKVNSQTVNLYFNLLLAQSKKNIAEMNVATADTLYQMGKRRFDIASIQHEELLDLELSIFNSKIELAQAEKNLEKTRFNLLSFLGFDNNEKFQPVLPDMVQGLQIDVENAFELAQQFNPEILGLKQKMIEAESNLERARKNSRFSADLNLSYGLNQSANNLNNAYRDPLDQQMASISINVPLLDWGNAKGQRQMAQSQKQVTEIEVKQALLDFGQEVKLKVIDFNLQSQVVLSSAIADSLAFQSYEVTKKRFMLGKVDVLRLTNAMKNSQQAKENYINSMATYWRYYYEVQQYTLYDFINNQMLEEDIDLLIGNIH
ncbi:MAG TPA: TolC family protein [Prolixibacteraceae bacterium]|nr:TolC family protein [Prolixibacteraceae bacterium]